MFWGFPARINLKQVLSKIGVVFVELVLNTHTYRRKINVCSVEKTLPVQQSDSTKLQTFPVPNHSELVKTTFRLPASSQLTAGKFK